MYIAIVVIIKTITLSGLIAVSQRFLRSPRAEI